VTAVSLMTHAFRHVPLSLGEQFLTSIARILSIKQCKQNSSWTSWPFRRHCIPWNITNYSPNNKA